jgi:CheY-like chemotaxis protein/AraC-like DNA-binding protein
MAMLQGSRKARFELATAAHQFILAALPLRHPASRNALATFVQTATDIRLPPAEVNAILLQILWGLNRQTHGRLPSLLDRYLALALGAVNVLARFGDCVEELLNYRGIRNRVVQDAVDLIHERYGDPKLTAPSIAHELGRNPDAFGTLFRFHTGLTVHGYLRNIRLDRAAILLTTTDKRVKEIWVAVGYNDGANFDHDFLKRFHVSPREYRARAIKRLICGPVTGTRPADPGQQNASMPRARVLIVDDDEGTRDVLGRLLRLDGYAVAVAGSGDEGLCEVASFEPDVLLLDYQLPDVDGLEFLRRVRHRTGAPQPAIVLFTADWDIYEHADEISALGGAIVSKPCFVEEIERLVQSVCAEKRGTCA